MMQLSEFFKNVGGDYESALQRLSSESLLDKFIRKFVEEPSYAHLQSALSEGNAEDAFRAAHTLKGTAASLGLGDLTEAARAVTETLRVGSVPTAEQLQKLDAAYRVTIENIQLLDAQ